MTLPRPEIIACSFDVGFVPPIAVMSLRWPYPVPPELHTLPGGERVHSGPPARFGIRILRQAEDAYALAVVWDSTYRQLFSLRRSEILGTAVEDVLASLGTRLDYLLEQPARVEAA